MATLKKTLQEKTVTFSLTAPDARTVTISGDFNNWNATNTRLRKGKDNVWRANLTLKPGKYEYKFVIDGNWTSDPNNNNRAWNSYGTENSIIEVK